ncbi:hypothetical protein NPIL_139341, partial [Nephila pilipes]
TKCCTNPDQWDEALLKSKFLYQLIG